MICFIYWLPIYLIILSYAKGFKSGFNGNAAKTEILAVLIISFLIAYLLGVIKFTIDIYPEDHFSRLHGRYYFVVFPLFMIGFMACFSRVNDSKRPRHVLGGLGTLFLFGNVFYFLPRYVTSGLTVVDNPDLAWFISENANLILPVSCGMALITYYYVRASHPSRAVYLTFILMYYLVGNFGHIKALIHYDSLNIAAHQSNIEFVSSQIPSNKSKVTIVGPNFGNRVFMSFVKTLDHQAVYDLPRGSKLTRELIPVSTDCLILFDAYQIDIPVLSSVTNGRCTVSFLNKAGIVD